MVSFVDADTCNIKVCESWESIQNIWLKFRSYISHTHAPWAHAHSQVSISIIWKLFTITNTLYRHLYELDTHLDRFLRSSTNAKILPPFPRETLWTILIQMTAASKCKKGSIRHWLSAGPGEFLLSPAGCPEQAFYVVIIDADDSQRKKGVKVITSTIPMKPHNLLQWRMWTISPMFSQ